MIGSWLCQLASPDTAEGDYRGPPNACSRLLAGPSRATPVNQALVARSDLCNRCDAPLVLGKSSGAGAARLPFLRAGSAPLPAAEDSASAASLPPAALKLPLRAIAGARGQLWRLRQAGMPRPRAPLGRALSDASGRHSGPSRHPGWMFGSALLRQRPDTCARTRTRAGRFFGLCARVRSCARVALAAS